MKKLAVFCILTLVLSALGVAQVRAASITVFDTVVEGSTGTWYNRGTNPGEDQEVEPNCSTGKAWDLEGFAINGVNLYTIGSYDFINGAEGYTSGDIFISTTGVPVYGTAAQGTGAGGDIANIFGYNYVLRMNWSAGTYEVYSISGSSILKTVNTGQNDESNPFAYVCDGDWVTSGSFYYETGLTNQQILELYGVTATDGPHNVVGVDLSFLSGSDIWFHFTQSCGNDNLMGHYVGTPIPLPPSALLLGTGLLGLVGLRWRRRQT